VPWRCATPWRSACRVCCPCPAVDTARAVDRGDHRGPPDGDGGRDNGCGRFSLSCLLLAQRPAPRLEPELSTASSGFQAARPRGACARGESHAQAKAQDRLTQSARSGTPTTVWPYLRRHVRGHRTCTATEPQPRSTPPRASFMTFPDVTRICVLYEVKLYLALPSPCFSPSFPVGPTRRSLSVRRRARFGSAAIPGTHDPSPRTAGTSARPEPTRRRRSELCGDRRAPVP